MKKNRRKNGLAGIPDFAPKRPQNLEFLHKNGDEVDHAPTRLGCSKLASCAEEDEFGDVAVIKPDAAAARAIVLSDFQPNDIGLVLESPGLHYVEAPTEKSIRA
jgi:hypothetical protein